MPTEPKTPAAAASDARPSAHRASDAPRVGRTGIVFGLTGVFSFVLGSLILTRPEPLRAHPIDPTLAAVNERVAAVLGTPSVAGTPGAWTSLIVQHATDADDSAGSAVAAHITVALDAPTGPIVRIVSPATRPTADQAHPAPLVVAVTGNPADDSVDWHDDPTVRLLVARLCDELKIDDRHVRWS